VPPEPFSASATVPERPCGTLSWCLVMGVPEPSVCDAFMVLGDECAGQVSVARVSGGL
jgi:hypothetical protein